MKRLNVDKNDPLGLVYSMRKWMAGRIKRATPMPTEAFVSFYKAGLLLASEIEELFENDKIEARLYHEIVNHRYYKPKRNRRHLRAVDSEPIAASIAHFEKTYGRDLLFENPIIPRTTKRPTKNRQRDAARLLCEFAIIRFVLEPFGEGPTTPSDVVPGFAGTGKNFKLLLERRQNSIIQISMHDHERARLIEACKAANIYWQETGTFEPHEFDSSVQRLADLVRTGEPGPVESWRIAVIFVQDWSRRIDFQHCVKGAQLERQIIHGWKFDLGIQPSQNGISPPR